MGILALLAVLTMTTPPSEERNSAVAAVVAESEDPTAIRERLALLQSEMVGPFMVALGPLEDSRAALDSLVTDERFMGTFARLLNTSRALSESQGDGGSGELARSILHTPPALLPAMRDALALIPLAHKLIGDRPRPAFSAAALMQMTEAVYDTSKPLEVGAGVVGMLFAPLAMLVLDAVGPSLSDDRRTELEHLANAGMRDALRLFVAVAEDRGIAVPDESLPAAERFSLAAVQALHDERLAALLRDTGS